MGMTEMAPLILFLSVTLAGIMLYPWLIAFWQRLLLRSELAIGPDLQMLEKGASVRKLIQTRYLVALGLVVVGFLLLNLPFGLLLGWVGYYIPGVMIRRRITQRQKRLTEQLVEGLELLGNALKSGLTLPQAIELLVKQFPPPLSTEFSRVLIDYRLGLDVTQALNAMARRLKLPVVNILATGVSVTNRCGGDLPQIFQHIVDTIRARASIEGKIEAVSSLGKFQALVLSGMPFALIILLFFIDRQHVEILFETKIGLAAVGAMSTLVVIANLWINRLMKIDA